ncbi:hypothetical protein IAI27_11405, partial [Streptococcus pseudopneumoniae]|nr:hypothetical protein [Streptococcus pseudopneumoniae]
MSSITVTSNDAAAVAKLQRLAQIVAKPAQALSGSAQALRRLVQDTFRDETD